jgi:ComF family protein
MRSASAVRRLAEEALDTLFPRACRVCGAAAADGFACDEHAFRGELRGPRCGRCALRLPEALPDGATCAACRRDGPAFAGVCALGDYHDEAGLREWCLALKHGRRRDLAALLGELLGGQARARAGDTASFVPVPLHWLRRLERGFDQALCLARAAARAADGRVVRALARARWTPPQGAPGARSRAANVRDAFVVRARSAPLLQGRSVWLVDDVVTSGATASACARALARAGAASVRVLCVARVEPRASATLPP